MRRRRKRRQISIASLKIFEEETSSSEEEEEAFLESGFEVSLGVCVFSKSSSSRDDVDDAFVTDRTGTPSSSSVEEQDEKEEEEEFVVRLSYAFDISNALVRSRLGTMMITNDKSENNNKDKDEEVLKTMVFTLKEDRFSFSSNEQKGNVSAHITLSVDAHEMQKILERVPLRVKENTACVFVETMKREDDNSKKYIVDDRLTVVAKHFRCEETGKLKRQFVNPFV